MLELTPNLDPKKHEPLYVQLYQYIKREIQTGSIHAGDKLPSKRKLSSYLHISQNTIDAAYQQLIAEGYVEGRARKGIFVCKLQEDLIIRTEREDIQEQLPVIENKQVYDIDFNHGGIALEHFPYSIWRKLTVESLYMEESALLLNGDRQGEYSLRKEITNYLFQSRGVRCQPEQLLIGAGTQFLVGLLALLLGRESIVAIEEPGYHRSREVFKDQGLLVKPISLDHEGVHMGELKKSNANAVYVTPSHQFPNGMVMPISRRMELLKWAEQNSSFVIEDDYDGEFRYKGKPVPSLQGLDPRYVVYLGTFSKSLIPSIRISYMVLPYSLLEKYRRDFLIYKQTVSRLHQQTLSIFMESGHWERHLNKMRTVYRKKQKILLSSINKQLGSNVKVIGEESGLHIIMSIQNGMSEKLLIEKAATKGVKVYPTSIYYIKSENTKIPEILLGFGGLKESEIEEGIYRLKLAWF